MTRSATALEDAKADVFNEIDARAETLIDISHRIWDHPELCFEEHFAHDLLCDTLASEGITVERGACDMPTAFVAEAGTSGPTIGVVCEYDALPGIGHACGHNIIAAAGLGAGLALAASAKKLGGRVRILGTPAEEGGGGKVYMIERGAFDDIDAAMMVHPADRELLYMSSLAVSTIRATYAGRASHASAAPEAGRNALDAAVMGYMGVAALRQHISDNQRVHGIFTDGGAKPNVVPARAETLWFVRSPDSAGLNALEERVSCCLQAGAHSAGCEVDLSSADMPPYDAIRGNSAFGALYAANASRFGRHPADPDSQERVSGSTDMGNVSQVVPSIHPIIKVAPDGVPIHTPEFTEHTGSLAGDAAVIDGAKMLAATALDLWLDEENLAAVKADFAASFEADAGGTSTAGTGTAGTSTAEQSR